MMSSARKRPFTSEVTVCSALSELVAGIVAPSAAGTARPPGETGRVAGVDQATGEANAEDGGQTEDQRILCWDGHYKDGRFQAAGPAETVQPGTRVYRDGYGVPAIYGDSSYD